MTKEQIDIQTLSLTELKKYLDGEGVAKLIDLILDWASDFVANHGVTSVEASGESPLSLSASKEGTAVTINGSVDAYSKSDVDTIRKEIEAEISTATGGGITAVSVSGTSPLTLNGSVSNGVATITGSVDLSSYATTANLANAYNQANSAYNAANTANNTASSAYTQANNAYNQANSANTLANTANATANNAYSRANTAYNQANDAYNRANTANTTANTANATANNALPKAGGTMTGNITLGTSGAIIYSNGHILLPSGIEFY